MDLGFKKAGYDIIWANDFQKEAVETYKKNIGEHIIHEDISNLSITDIPKAEILIGGPPCQSFSLAGRRNPNDKRGKLVWEYLKILRNLKPRSFIMENVIGLKSAVIPEGRKVIDELIEAFQEIGYHVFWEALNMADYGIPQRRKRLFIIGFIDNVNFTFPAKTHSEDGNDYHKWVSVKEAIGDLPKATKEGIVYYDKEAFSDFQRIMRNTEGYTTEHIIPTLSELDMKIILSVPQGGNYMNVPDEISPIRIQKFKQTGGRTTCYGRLIETKPSYTINTYFNRPNSGCNIHYEENRTLTIREAMRLQTFPDDFILVSNSIRAKHMMIGNAIPPMFAEILANHIKKFL